MTTPVYAPLPETAKGRLANSQQGKPCFTSDLSVTEFRPGSNRWAW